MTLLEKMAWCVVFAHVRWCRISHTNWRGAAATAAHVHMCELVKSAAAAAAVRVHPS